MAMGIDLHDFHATLNDQQHVIVNIAFANHHLGGFGAIDMHEGSQALDVFAREICKESGMADHVEYLLRESGALAKMFQGIQQRVRRPLDMCFGHLNETDLWS